MQEATTHFATEDGQKYLTQLCKHFAHKVDVEQAGDRAELRPVVTGVASGSDLEITSGLEPGERVVIRGNERLQPGVAVRILAPAEEPAAP